MLPHRTWLPALVAVALTGCGADTATTTTVGAPSSGASSDAAVDAAVAADASGSADGSTPRSSSPHSGVTVIAIGGEGFASDQPVKGTWEVPTCGDQAEQLSLTGSSPLGPLHVTSVGVRYWSGFTYGTGLRLEGKLGDRPMLLTAEGATSPTAAGLRPELPPGHYRTGDSWDDLYVTLLTGESQVSLHDAELTIEQHDSAQPLRRGAPVSLRGTLRILEPGWSLDLTFAITTVCETNFEGSLP